MNNQIEKIKEINTIAFKQDDEVVQCLSKKGAETLGEKINELVDAVNALSEPPKLVDRNLKLTHPTPMNNQCCVKCRDYLWEDTVRYSNPSCECHNPTPPQEDWITEHAYILNKMKCVNCGRKSLECLRSGCHPTPPQENIEMKPIKETGYVGLDTPPQSETRLTRDFIRNFITYSLPGHMTDDEWAVVLNNIEALLNIKQDESRQDLIKEVEGIIMEMGGISRNPDYFIRLEKRLEGNIAMKGIDDFQFTQISWEAKDLIINDLLASLKKLKQ